MWRWILGAVASLIVGAVLLARYYSGLPALDQLATVEGVVASADVETRRSRRSRSQVLAVQIGDARPTFYLERFPDFERVAGAIRPGDRVTAWVDAGRNDYIWQLDKGGERVVSYDQVAAAQRSNDRGNALFGALFLAVGLGVLGYTLWQWRVGAPPAPQGGEG